MPDIALPDTGETPLHAATSVPNRPADWTGDHGAGWRGRDAHLLGKPHV